MGKIVGKTRDRAGASIVPRREMLVRDDSFINGHSSDGLRRLSFTGPIGHESTVHTALSPKQDVSQGRSEQLDKCLSQNKLAVLVHTSLKVKTLTEAFIVQ